MKILKLENIIIIITVIIFFGLQILSSQQDYRRAERQENCVTQVKGDNSPLDICHEISSGTNGSVYSGRFSIYPLICLLVRIISVLAIKTRRLEVKVKELKEKLDV